MGPGLSLVRVVTGFIKRRKIGRHINRVFTQYFERHDLGRKFVCAGKHDRGSGAVHMGTKPVSRSHAPAVTRIQAGESVLRRRCSQCVSDAGLVIQKLAADDGTDGMAAYVAGIGVAAAVAVPAGHWFGPTRFKRAAEHIAGFRSVHSPSIALVAGWERDVALLVFRLSCPDRLVQPSFVA